jgi:DNA gyrase subunit B
MDPDRRTLLRITLEDASTASADLLFSKLMGENVQARKEWIEENAKDVQNLDV